MFTNGSISVPDRTALDPIPARFPISTGAAQLERTKIFPPVAVRSFRLCERPFSKLLYIPFGEFAFAAFAPKMPRDL